MSDSRGARLVGLRFCQLVLPWVVVFLVVFAVAMATVVGGLPWPERIAGAARAAAVFTAPGVAVSLVAWGALVQTRELSFRRYARWMVTAFAVCVGWVLLFEWFAYSLGD